MKKERKLRLRRIAEKAARRRQKREGETICGIIHMTPAGFGFLSPETGNEKGDDIFIPAKFTGFALDGDRVKIKLLPPRKGHPEDSERGPVGKVLEILHRSRESFVAELLPGSFVSPLNTRLPEIVSIRGSRHGAQRGDWVKVKCITDRDGELTGTISEVIGQAGNISGDLDAIMAEFDLPGKYTAAEEEESSRIIPAEIARKDCRNLFVLTIDPFDAKDFDDALSIEKSDDGNFIVGIHIADVAAYIRPRDKFDQSARRRAFSCYLPGRTLPMLPAQLTAKISMQQGVDSLAHSVFLTVSPEGKILSGKREHTLIKVSRRLDYDEVQNFLDSGTVPENWHENTPETLTILAQVVGKMREYRAKTEEFIDLPLPEVRVICDEKTNTVTGIEKRISRPSEQLVEECMLAANQFVGRELPQKSVAGIYRIHPEPEPEKTLEFSETMHEAFNLPTGDISDRSYCRQFINPLPDDANKSLILSMLLRSLARASYSVRGDLHFALGKTFYAHFTSPIRRYTDLTVHQQLWNLDSGNRTRNASALEGVADYCSAAEENIDAACFAANDRLKLRIVEEVISREPGKMFDCTVIRILNSGIQVELPEYALTAFVNYGDLRKTASMFRIGESLPVRGDRLNFAGKRN